MTVRAFKECISRWDPKAYRKLSQNITQISTKELVLRKSTRKFKKLMKLLLNKNGLTPRPIWCCGCQWWPEQVVLVAFDGAGFGGFEDIFSNFFGGGASVKSKCLVRGWPPIPRQSQFGLDFGAERDQSTIRKLAVIPGSAGSGAPSQGLVRWPVDAVLVLESSVWIHKPLLG